MTTSHETGLIIGYRSNNNDILYNNIYIIEVEMITILSRRSNIVIAFWFLLIFQIVQLGHE